MTCIVISVLVQHSETFVCAEVTFRPAAGLKKLLERIAAAFHVTVGCVLHVWVAFGTVRVSLFVADDLHYLQTGDVLVAAFCDAPTTIRPAKRRRNNAPRNNRRHNSLPAACT